MLVQGELSKHRAHRRPRPGAAARGLPVGQRARTPRRGSASLPPVCREIAELKPAKVVFGPAHLHQHGGQRRSSSEFAQAPSADAAPGRRRRPRPRASSPQRRGDPPAEQERLAQRGVRRGDRAVHAAGARSSALRYGLTGIPRIDDPDFVVHARVRHGASDRACRSRASPTCSRAERGADQDPAASPDLSDAERRRAIELFETATERARVPAARGRALHRDRRAGGEPRGWPTRCRARSSCCSARRCW